MRHDFRPLSLVYPEVVNIRFGVLLVGVLAVSALALAQEQGLQKLLPPDARIIETANVTAAGHRPRTLVLWMANPKRLSHQGDMYCGEHVYGDYWEGPTRLSLVDIAEQTLINTIVIQRFFVGPDDRTDVLRIPSFVPSGYYEVPHPNAQHQGTPKILNLRDLTGQGVIGQFVLFEYVGCGITQATALGYSPTADKAVQYPMETVEGKHKPDLETWVPQIFSTEPTRPGYWHFTWEAGHGDWFWNDEDVSFDQKRQLFVRRLNRRPYPGFGEASCDLEAKRLSPLLESFKPLFGSGFTDSQIHGLEQTAEAGPPSDGLLATPFNTVYKGKNIDVEILMRKYEDGDIGLWIVTEPELAAQIQRKMDEVLR